MIPNAPRKRIDYVAKQLPAVLHETAYVVAHTVGANRDEIERRMQRREPVSDLFAETAHKHEALIPWVAKELNAAMREVKKGRIEEHEFVDLVNLLEAKLPNIAVWVESTRPDLNRLTAAEVISAAAKFGPDEGAPVPQGEVIYKFDDGWTVQELTTPEQIFAEGEAAQNCLRKGASGKNYAQGVEEGTTRIFSLRTPAGSPRVSMEFQVDPDSEYGGRFAQVYAKQNTSLGATLEKVLEGGGTKELWEGIQKYRPRIVKFIREKFGGEPSGLVMLNEPLPAGLTSVGGGIDLYGYQHPLPAGLKSVGGSLFGLNGYPHPLPDGLTSVGGSLYLEDYRYPLPAGLKSVGGNLGLYGYKHPLPAGLASVGGFLSLGSYKHPLPAGLKSVGGNLDLRGYMYPLPAGLKSVGGYLVLRGYNRPLPAGLNSVGGSLDLEGYPHPPPAGLASVGGSLYLRGYMYPLPAGLKSVGGTLVLSDYKYPLPKGLTSVGGGLDLSRYPHPLPAGLKSVGGFLRLDDYPHPLPAGLKVEGAVYR